MQPVEVGDGLLHAFLWHGLPVLHQRHAGFVLFNRLENRCLRVEKGVQYRAVVVEVIALRQIRNHNIIADDDLSLVGGVESGNDIEERAFPRAVAGDEGAFLPLLQTKRDLVEEFLLAHGLGDFIDGEVVHAGFWLLALGFWLLAFSQWPIANS